MSQGQIIFLNGTSSSGKSTIAKALLDVMDEPYLHTGIDHFLERYPDRMITYSDGVDPAHAEGWLAVFRDDTLIEVRIGPAGYRMIAGMYRAIAALAEAGLNVVVDDVMYDPHVLEEAVATLHEYDVFFVGVRCALDVAERRERERGDRAKGGARAFHYLVHRHAIYDLEIDSAQLSAEECAAHIKRALRARSTPHAFAQLQHIFAHSAAR